MAILAGGIAGGVIGWIGLQLAGPLLMRTVIVLAAASAVPLGLQVLRLRRRLAALQASMAVIEARTRRSG